MDEFIIPALDHPVVIRKIVLELPQLDEIGIEFLSRPLDKPRVPLLQLLEIPAAPEELFIDHDHVGTEMFHDLEVVRCRDEVVPLIGDDDSLRFDRLEHVSCIVLHERGAALVNPAEINEERHKCGQHHERGD